MQVHPTDELYPLQWYLRTMKVPEAWTLLQQMDPAKKYGDTELIISIIDQGLGSIMVNNELGCCNPDLQASVGNGLSKIYSFYDFLNNVPDNNSLLDTNGHIKYHGINCAGLAAANTGGKISKGMIGVAPSCRLMGIKRSEDVSDTKLAEALLRSAGFVDVRGQYVYHNDRACDIINCSFDWTYNHGVPEDLVKAGELLLEKGRNGKGTILVCAAGNNSGGASSNKLPKYVRHAIVVAASSIDADGNEVLTGYSNYSDGYVFVDICAPSSLVNDDELENDPEGNHGVVTTTYPGEGNIGGHRDHVNHFGGTSAAAPLVSGVIALMLTANPELTAAEVKQILHDTATMIDEHNTDENGAWVERRPQQNQRPQFYSKKLGWGRVNAENAVRQALHLRR